LLTYWWTELFKKEPTTFHFEVNFFLKKIKTFFEKGLLYNKFIIFSWILSTYTIFVEKKSALDIFVFKCVVVLSVPFFKKVKFKFYAIVTNITYIFKKNLVFFLKIVTSFDYGFFKIYFIWPYIYILVLLSFFFKLLFKEYYEFYKTVSSFKRNIFHYNYYVITDIYRDTFFSKINLYCVRYYFYNIYDLKNSKFSFFIYSSTNKSNHIFSHSYRGIIYFFKLLQATIFILFNTFLEFFRIFVFLLNPFILIFQNFCGWFYYFYRELYSLNSVFRIFYKYNPFLKFLKNKFLNFFPRLFYKFFKINEFFYSLRLGFYKIYKYLYAEYWYHIYVGRNYPLLGIEKEIDDSQVREFTWCHLEWREEKNIFLFEHINNSYVIARLRRINKKKFVNADKRLEYLYRYNYFEWSTSFNKCTFSEKQSKFASSRSFIAKKYSNTVRDLWYKPAVQSITSSLLFLLTFQIHKNFLLKFFYGFSGKTGFMQSKSLFIEGQINQNFSMTQLYHGVRYDTIGVWSNHYSLYNDYNFNCDVNYTRVGWWPDRGKLPARNVIYTHWKYDIHGQEGSDYYWFVSHRSVTKNGYLNFDYPFTDDFVYFIIII